MESNSPSIEYLDLYAVAIDILLWIRHFANRRVVIFCDNISVVWMINKATSSCKHCLTLVRVITLECLVQNVQVYAKDVKSKENDLADSLSQGKIDLFWCKVKAKGLQVKSEPEVIPEELWPMSKVW